MHLRQQFRLELFADPPREREAANDQRQHHAGTGQRPANEPRINSRIAVRTVGDFSAAKLRKQPPKLRADFEDASVGVKRLESHDANLPNQREADQLQQQRDGQAQRKVRCREQEKTPAAPPALVEGAERTPQLGQAQVAVRAWAKAVVIRAAPQEKPLEYRVNRQQPPSRFAAIVQPLGQGGEQRKNADIHPHAEHHQRRCGVRNFLENFRVIDTAR